MTTRTVYMYGYGYGPSDATMTVKVNNSEVFSGSVTTLNEPVPPNDQLGLTPDGQPCGAVLCRFDIPSESVPGQIPMEVSVDSQVVVLANFTISDGQIANPIFTQSDYQTMQTLTTRSQMFTFLSAKANPPFSQQDQDTYVNPSTTPQELKALRAAHGVDFFVPGPVTVSSGNTKLNTTIDGVLQPITMPDVNLWYAVYAGSVMAFDLDIDPFVPPTLVGGL